MDTLPISCTVVSKGIDNPIDAVIYQTLVGWAEIARDKFPQQKFSALAQGCIGRHVDPMLEGPRTPHTMNSTQSSP
jgi:hypothetical protein